MKNDINKILDECIDRIIRGDSIESCLNDFPELVEQLKPLLENAVNFREAFSFIPSPEVKRAARAHFHVALDESRQKRESSIRWFDWFQGWSRVWATAATVLIIAVIVYFGVIARIPSQDTSPYTKPGTMPSVTEPGTVALAPSSEPEGAPISPGTEPEITPVSPEPEPESTPVSPNPKPEPELIAALPSTDGNFIFLISDDVNAISDFESVVVSIAKISLLKKGDPDQLIEFAPEVGEVDLTQVQGEETQEIWRGDIPDGEYSRVSIEVSDVSGVLKETLEEVEIKLPSNKLHLSTDFEINDETLIMFTYDLTVVAAGNTQSGIKYLLKPQLDQSGTIDTPLEPKGQAKKEEPADI